jgi:multidrug resistance protein, MATE family
MSSATPSARAEARAIAGHAATILVGQLAVMAFGVVDTLVAGRHSTEALAALSVGASIYISVYVSLLGVVQALLPIYAEHRGAGRQLAVGRAFRQALYLSFVLIVVGVVALLFPGPLLRWAKVPDALLGDVQNYLAVLAIAFAPAIWFRMYANLSQALGKPWLVTTLQLAGLALKIPLSVALTFGWAGLPSLGVVGCAWATLAVNVLIFACALALLRKADVFRAASVWARLERPDWPQIRSFVRLGLPGGLATMFEVTSFTLMAVFIARLGASASASHQIASNLTALLYMLPLSFGLAASARTSWHLGAGHPVQAARTIRLSFGLIAGVSIALSAIIFIANQTLAQLYSTDARVVALAAQLLPWVALYHLMDATQGLAGFLLRCYRVAVLPAFIYAVLLWGLGLGGGYWLSYHGLSFGPVQLTAMQSPSAFWIAATAATGVVALVFVALLAVHARRSIANASQALGPSRSA